MVVHDRDGHEIKKGDMVLFREWIAPDVPLHLTGSTGYVEEITRRGKLVVRASMDDYGIRRVWPKHVVLWRGRTT